MSLRFKIYLAVAAAVLVGTAFFVFEHTTDRLLRSHADLLAMVGNLERLDAQLDNEVLRSGFLLYHNYDALHGYGNEIEALLGQIETLLASRSGDYAAGLEQVDRYRKAFAEKRRNIEDWQTLNSVIKNSATYVPSLSRRLIAKLDNLQPEYLLNLSNAVAAVSLAKNSMDEDFIAELLRTLEALKHFPLDGDKVLRRFNEVFIGHLRVFLTYFPPYAERFDAIMAADTRGLAHSIRSAIVGASERQSRRMSLFSRLLAAAFGLAIALIVYFLLKTERENKELIRLQNRLREAATTDRVTGLRNRFGFELDTPGYASPALWLANIDGFKHVNDFYGNRAGDEVLRRVGETLEGLAAELPRGQVYRLGADDFGIVQEANGNQPPELLGQRMLRAVEELRVYYQDNEISVSVSVSASRTAPLLETADMALKSLKESRERFRAYQPNLDIYRRIEQNLEMLEIIKDALHRDAVVPFFQPICNNHTGRIEKYECLARIVRRDGTVLSPGAFLDIAKRSRLYADITRVMLDKSFATFADSPFEFSVNLSIEDIADERIHDLILQRLAGSPEIGKRAIFEILESEGIDDYGFVAEFIREVKAFGCKIAIDDFGTGYSNMDHLLNLDVDFVKIDASLIKHLDTDANAQALVQTVVDFSRKIRVRCITAEYVHSAPVLEKVRAMGVDYSQGYFIGVPQAHPGQAPNPA